MKKALVVVGAVVTVIVAAAIAYAASDTVKEAVDKAANTSN